MGALAVSCSPGYGLAVLTSPGEELWYAFAEGNSDNRLPLFFSHEIDANTMMGFVFNRLLSSR